jgi:drug/metabolite transporter (DMT)-like permease
LEANLIGMLEPVLNPIWVFFFYGESMGRFALVGGLIVLGGVILSAVGSAKAAKEEKQETGSAEAGF